VAWTDPVRREPFEAWFAPLAARRGLDRRSLRPASSDASFRRYLRVHGEPGSALPSAIVMDAPPPQEDVRPFVRIAMQLRAAGIEVPEVLDVDASNGFLLLGDLGDGLLLDALRSAEGEGDPRRSDALMREAIATLVRMQSSAKADDLPPYDAPLLRRELELFPTWCVEQELGVTWSDAQRALWQQSSDLLVASALAQPAVFVHRDYMPRNLMRCAPPRGSPGVLDFQDAVRGPVTYDIVCLLRDAFLSWDEEREIDWAVRYWEQARRAALPVEADFGDFWRALEWMGAQRHLKVLGIFCRLKHRDAKPAYSADLPRFWRYLHQVATRYRELAGLVRLIEPLMGEHRIDAFY
jgi:hypothetical protein